MITITFTDKLLLKCAWAYDNGWSTSSVLASSAAKFSNKSHVSKSLRCSTKCVLYTKHDVYSIMTLSNLNLSPACVFYYWLSCVVGSTGRAQRQPPSGAGTWAVRYKLGSERLWRCCLKSAPWASPRRSGRPCRTVQLSAVLPGEGPRPCARPRPLRCWRWAPPSYWRGVTVFRKRSTCCTF